MGGIKISLTKDVTILPNAPPMMTATARSRTLPRTTKSLNSFNIVWPPDGKYCCKVFYRREYGLSTRWTFRCFLWRTPFGDGFGQFWRTDFFHNVTGQ